MTFMLNYNDLKPGIFMVYEGQPYVVMEFHFLRMQQRKPVVQTKIRNIITGKTVEKTFQPSDKFEEAEIETKPIKYLYSNKPARRGGGGEHWFCEKTTRAPDSNWKKVSRQLFWICSNRILWLAPKFSTKK